MADTVDEFRQLLAAIPKKVVDRLSERDRGLPAGTAPDPQAMPIDSGEQAQTAETRQAWPIQSAEAEPASQPWPEPATQPVLSEPQREFWPVQSEQPEASTPTARQEQAPVPERTETAWPELPQEGHSNDVTSPWPIPEQHNDERQEAEPRFETAGDDEPEGEAGGFTGSGESSTALLERIADALDDLVTLGEEAKREREKGNGRESLATPVGGRETGRGFQSAPRDEGGRRSASPSFRQYDLPVPRR